jgi:predicted nucleic acid-binding Zn ribbon protein
MSWDDDTTPCPHCGAAVYEDAERCPHCEQYLSEEDAPARKPTWFVACAIVCLILAVWWVVRGM